MKDFRDWLSKEQVDALIYKAKEGGLSADEQRLFVEELAYFGCPWEEIATLLNTSTSYLHYNFRDAANRASARWRFDLRKAQAINAFTGRGDKLMLIWLGKQYLSQKDDPMLEVKKDKFDEIIEWIRQQPPSESVKSSETSSSIPMPEEI